MSKSRNVYPVDEIVASLMFSYGDSEQPLDECVVFMSDLVHDQLSRLVDQSRDLCKQRKQSSSIGFDELVFLFRRHPQFVRRFIIYMRMRESLPLLVDGIDGPSCSGEERKNPTSRRCQRLFKAVRNFDVYEEHSEAMDSDKLPVDAVQLSRYRLISQRTYRMDRKTYERFCVARRASFCAGPGGESAERPNRKMPAFSRDFLSWIGVTDCQDVIDIAFVLNFCGVEIVAELVNCSLLCREHVNRRAAVAGQTDELPRLAFDVLPIQLCHYTEALSRSIGYRKRGDLLFGHF